MALKGKNTQTCPIIELYILFHEQVVYRRGTKWEKAYLTSLCTIAMWLYHSLALSKTTSLLIRKQSQTEVRNGFQKYDVTP